jgi:hypothetical protein
MIASYQYHNEKAINVVHIYIVLYIAICREMFITRSVIFFTVPKLYPQEVYAHSLSSSSVRITWRGISTAREEETLAGYIVSRLL